MQQLPLGSARIAMTAPLLSPRKPSEYQPAERLQHAIKPVETPSIICNVHHVGRKVFALDDGIVIMRRREWASAMIFLHLPNAPVLLRAVCFQGTLQSLSYDLDRGTTQRLSRARLQQLPLGGRNVPSPEAKRARRSLEVINSYADTVQLPARNIHNFEPATNRSTLFDLY